MDNGSSFSEQKLHAGSSDSMGGMSTADDTRYRIEWLTSIHKVFDIDGSGTVDKVELLELGQARRSLGHKKGEWTKEMNDKLLKKIDRDGDGQVDANEFATYFADHLPKDRGTFDFTMDQFMEVAKACARKKKEAKNSREKSEASDLNERARKAKASVDAKRANEELGVLEGRWAHTGSSKSGNKKKKSEDPRAERTYRVDKLIAVHKAFDIDGGGYIEKDELFELGKARRKLGHKSGEWTKEMNDRMFANLDKGGDGKVEADEFSHYFANQFKDESREAFDKVMEQFMQVARVFNIAKKNADDDKAKVRRGPCFASPCLTQSHVRTLH